MKQKKEKKKKRKRAGGEEKRGNRWRKENAFRALTVISELFI